MTNIDELVLLSLAAIMTAEDPRFSVITEDFVNVFVSSNVKSFLTEKKLPKDVTLRELRGKLELITGGSSLTMKLVVFNKNDDKVTFIHSFLIIDNE